MLPKHLRYFSLLALGSLLPFAANLNAQDEDSAPTIRLRAFGDQEIEEESDAQAPSPAEATSTETAESQMTDEQKLFLIYGWYLGSERNMHMLDMSDDERKAFVYGLTLAMDGQGIWEDWRSAMPVMQQMLASRIQPKMEAYAKEIARISTELFPKLDKDETVKKTASGLYYRIDSEGTGDFPQDGDLVMANFISQLPDGSVIDTSESKGRPGQFMVTEDTMPGLVEGLKMVREGGIINLWVPPALAYGDQGRGIIPGNSAIFFRIEMLSILDPEEIKSMQDEQAAAQQQAGE